MLGLSTIRVIRIKSDLADTKWSLKSVLHGVTMKTNELERHLLKPSQELEEAPLKAMNLPSGRENLPPRADPIKTKSQSEPSLNVNPPSIMYCQALQHGMEK
ncbi:unnamed protein product [Linum trigynum]|uniref:Uncharacterized protein n=1 Tax=Linum trigynum TaxID=586398 RepID=A0AAV2E4U8_9ROSI